MAKTLIVCDQPYLQGLFSQELMREGHSVVNVGDAESVERYLEDLRPDLVLLDLYLNGFGGLKDCFARNQGAFPVIQRELSRLVNFVRAAGVEGIV